MRKLPIIIGDTYIYDYKCETDLALYTTVVTVMNKIGRHKYEVMATEGDHMIFTCKDKYLTKYNKQLNNIVYRNPYGISEFSYDDVNALQYILYMLDSIVITHPGSNKTIDLTDPIIKNSIENAHHIIENMKNKVNTYAEMSAVRNNYKTLGFLHKCKEKVDKEESSKNLEEKRSVSLISDEANRGIKTFEDTFSQKVNAYIEECNNAGLIPSCENMLNFAIDQIKTSYPKDTLLLNEKIKILKSDIEQLSNELRSGFEYLLNAKVDNDQIVLIIFIANPKDNNDLVIKTFTCETVNDISDAIEEMYEPDKVSKNVYMSDRILAYLTMISSEDKLDDDDDEMEETQDDD